MTTLPKIRLFRFLTIFGFCIGAPLIISAQNQPKASIKEIISAVNAYSDKLSVEKLYLQTHGPFVKKAMGTYLYKPLAFTLPKKFYTPKYKPESKADMTDIRSTVYWDPNIITDKDGKASISFYTADIPGTYSVIIEGSDMAGNLGSERTVIAVEK